MKPLNRNEDGQVIVLVALGLAVLSLMAGLAIDIGYLRYEKQQMQKATDAGALAAAAVLLNYGTNTTQAMLTDAATADVTANGFKTASVTVTNPPASGPFAGNSNYVQVQVQESFPVFFMRVGGWSTVPVRDTAVGSAVGNASGCIYALDSNQGDTGFLSESLVSFATFGCGIYVNSNAQTSGTVNAGSAEIGVVGTSSGSFSPTPVAVPSFIDPLAGLPMPAVPPSCDHTNYQVPPQSPSLEPGIYCGGITISGSATVTFNGGTTPYILKGGGLTVSPTATVNGTGVTFYNTYFPGQYPYAPINLSGSSGVLRAPTTGTYAGILAFQDRSVPSNYLGSTFDNSNGESYIGALYFPTTAVTYKGNSANHFATLIVAWQVSISGTADFDAYAGSFRPSPVHSAALVQ